MNRFFKNSLYILIFIFSSSQLWAQNPYFEIKEDFNLWSQIGLSQKYSKKWKADYALNYRLNENASQFSSVFFDYTLKRDLKNKFSSNTVFRFSKTSKSYVFRLSPDLRKSFRLDPFNINYRLKTDIDWDIPNFQIDVLDWRFRNKFDIEFSKKKYKLGAEIGIEWFHFIENSTIYLQNIRYTSGISYDLSKDLSIGVGFFIQQEYNATKPYRDYILNWKMSYDLPKKQKKKEK